VNQLIETPGYSVIVKDIAVNERDEMFICAD